MKKRCKELELLAGLVLDAEANYEERRRFIAYLAKNSSECGPQLSAILALDNASRTLAASIQKEPGIDVMPQIGSQLSTWSPFITRLRRIMDRLCPAPSVTAFFTGILCAVAIVAVFSSLTPETLMPDTRFHPIALRLTEVDSHAKWFDEAVVNPGESLHYKFFDSLIGDYYLKLLSSASVPVSVTHIIKSDHSQRVHDMTITDVNYGFLHNPQDDDVLIIANHGSTPVRTMVTGDRDITIIPPTENLAQRKTTTFASCVYP
ncbi:hypothetical protein [Desulfovibrio inopinatus]|uniref:hypothetical protein n=1 Tax=Desulfovibrio inopinatus TaxID=102109 RepID=UPI0003FD85DF|nr:hypothetical protein [Desulfovibrio inopinatus]